MSQARHGLIALVALLFVIPVCLARTSPLDTSVARDRQRRDGWLGSRERHAVARARHRQGAAAGFDTVGLLGVSNPLTLLSARSFPDYLGDYVLVGEVRNNSASSLAFAQVTIELIGSGGIPVGSDYTFVHGSQNGRLAASGIFTDILPPNAVGFFKVWTNVPAASVAGYVFSSEGDSYALGTVYGGLELAGPVNVSSSFFGPSYAGTMRNPSSVTTYFSEINVAGYLNGSIADVDFTFADGTAFTTCNGVTTDTGVRPAAQAAFSSSFSNPVDSIGRVAFTWDESGISPRSQAFPSAGGTGTVNVTNLCALSATSNVPWASVSGIVGTGDIGTMNYAVAPNISAITRSGTLTIAGEMFTITQAPVSLPCSYAVSPTGESFPAVGGNGTVSVLTTAGCAWTASPSASFVTITFGAGGTGTGAFSYEVSANPTTTSRNATIGVGGASLSVVQAGKPALTCALVGDDTDADGIPNTVELVESADPCVKDNDVFAIARLFAMQQYRDFLGREGDRGGILFWTATIGGGTSRAAVTKSFFDSPEFQGAIAPVTRLYFAYFNRIPDLGGLQYWIGQYRLGMPLNDISQAFAGSPEFVGTYGGLTNEEFVTVVYQNVLARAPDPAGLAYWKGQLDNLAMTRGQVMVGFSESPEYQARSYNWVFVTMMYYGMLRRVPEQNGFDFWVANLNAGVPTLNLINGFLGAPEYRGRFLN